MVKATIYPSKTCPHSTAQHLLTTFSKPGAPNRHARAATDCAGTVQSGADEQRGGGGATNVAGGGIRSLTWISSLTARPSICCTPRNNKSSHNFPSGKLRPVPGTDDSEGCAKFPRPCPPPSVGTASGPRWRRQPKRLPTPKKSEKHTPKALGAAPGRFASLLGHDTAASSPALPEQTCPIQSGEGATATLERQVARVFSLYPQLASEFIDFPICKFDT